MAGRKSVPRITLCVDEVARMPNLVFQTLRLEKSISFYLFLQNNCLIRELHLDAIQTIAFLLCSFSRENRLHAMKSIRTKLISADSKFSGTTRRESH